LPATGKTVEPVLLGRRLAKNVINLGMQPRWLTVPGFEALRSMPTSAGFSTARDEEI
jgi:hypothetical protein